MDEQRQDDQQEPTNDSNVPIQDVAFKTYQKRWTIEKGGERGSGISVLMVRHDDDDDDDDTGYLSRLSISVYLSIPPKPRRYGFTLFPKREMKNTQKLVPRKLQFLNNSILFLFSKDKIVILPFCKTKIAAYIFGLVWFYGISTLVGCLMQNSLYTYIYIIIIILMPPA